eukprot:2981526-Amphidinium_carterae.1
MRFRAFELFVARPLHARAQFAFTRVAARYLSAAQHEAYKGVPQALQGLSCVKQGQLFETLAREVHVSHGWTVSDPECSTDINGQVLGKNSTPYDYMISADFNKEGGESRVRVE